MSNIMTFHTILNIYYHMNKRIIFFFFIMVAIQLNKQHHKFCDLGGCTILNMYKYT